MGRKTIGLLGLAVACGLASLAGHLSAASPEGENAAPANATKLEATPRPAAGDNVRIYLDYHSSPYITQLTGVVTSHDDRTICIRTVVNDRVMLGGNVVRTEKRETLQWVSYHAIVFIEKLPPAPPATQPATQPAAAP